MTDIEAYMLSLPSLVGEGQRICLTESLGALETVVAKLVSASYILGTLEGNCRLYDLHGLFRQLRLEVVRVLELCQDKLDDMEEDNTDGGALATGVLSSVVEEEKTMGRPFLSVSDNDISQLNKMFGSWTKVASALGVSSRTLLRRRREYGMDIGSARYSDMFDAKLEDTVAEILEDSPNAGEVMINGQLRARSITVQRYRLRQSLYRVDPISRCLRQAIVIVRGEYRVPGPNALWHFDGNHKLITWKFVVHGCIDGFSRVITYLQRCDNNRADTVCSLFVTATRKYGVPSRVRCDRGGENVDVASFMLGQKGLNRGTVLCGSSVHNQRIERFWVDVRRMVLGQYRNLFHYFEDQGTLNICSERDLFCLHYVYLPRINRSLENFIGTWNNHAVRKQRGMTPLHLRSVGVIGARHDLDAVDDGYGVDDEAPIPMPDASDENGVFVSRIDFDISPPLFARLRREVVPLRDDGHQGYNLYLKARDVLT